MRDAGSTHARPASPPQSVRRAHERFSPPSLFDPSVRVALALVAGLSGCVAPKHAEPVVDRPGVKVSASVAPGTPLGEAAAPAVAVVSGDTLTRLDVTWIAVHRPPLEGTVPLDARAVLASAPLAGGALLTSGGATARVRFAEGDAADALLDRLRRRVDGAAVDIGHAVADVGPGTTARFACDAGPGRTPATRSFRLAVARPAVARPATADAPSAVTSAPATTASTTTPSTTTPSMTTAATTPATEAATAPLARTSGTFTVGLQGFAAASDASAGGGDADDAAPATGGLETAYLEGLSLEPGDRYAFVTPLRFAGTPWGGLVAFVSVEAVPVDQRLAAADRLTAALNGHPATAPAPATRGGDALELRSAVDALRRDADPRAPLAFLASATNAAIAADVVLLADRPTLERLKQDVLRASPPDRPAASTLPAAPAGAGSPAATGWLLDRTALLTLCGDEKHPPPPELAAVLVVHAGETGRHPDALAEVVKSVGSAADLHARLVAENYIALEDNAPAARVRAFDWLAAQGRAPAGFDPLGDAKARRDAIDRALSTNGATP